MAEEHEGGLFDHEVEESTRLDKYLALILPSHSRTKLARLIENGAVLVNGVSQKPRFMLKVGMTLDVLELPSTPLHNLQPIPMDLPILYEDESLLVVNKPRGLITHPAISTSEPTLVHGLLAHSARLSEGAAQFRPGIVHRLDKDTSGLLVVAKTDQAHVILAAGIAAKTTERRYLAILGAKLEGASFAVNAPIGRDPKSRLKMAVVPGGKDALTIFRPLGPCAGGTLCLVRLQSGRTHQIRVHALAAKAPVRGDKLYAHASWSDGPMQLHAAFLRFKHPITGDWMEHYCPPPDDFFGRNFQNLEREVLAG